MLRQRERVGWGVGKVWGDSGRADYFSNAHSGWDGWGAAICCRSKRFSTTIPNPAQAELVEAHARRVDLVLLFCPEAQPRRDVGLKSARGLRQAQAERGWEGHFVVGSGHGPPLLGVGQTAVYAEFMVETPAPPIDDQPNVKRAARLRADQIRDFRCKNLIAVIEDPQNPRNIGTVIRNVNALGVEKVYVVDPRGVLPDDWDDLRTDPKLAKLSVSAVKWTFVKRFDSTEACLSHLEKNKFASIVTSPHVKGKASVFLHEGDYAEHAKLAVWFGNETKGISSLAVERSSLCVAIPMFGMIESLNLGTSSGIVLYEVAKQRREYASRFRLRDQRGERAVPLPTVISPEL